MNMVRVSWWNGGVRHEDVPEDIAMQRVNCYTRCGFLCWWKHLDQIPPPVPAQAA